MTRIAPSPSSDDRPGAFPWPPVLLLLTIVLALSTDTLLVPLPVPFAETVPVQVVGWAMLIGGIGLTSWAATAFRNHNTSIRPDRGADDLIETGPYAWSRNPIYLGEAVALVGAALVFNRLTLGLAAPLFVLAVWRLSILPEEAYLERRFGDRYRAYCDRVDRWFC